MKKIVMIVCVVFFCIGISANDGALDPTFGISGRVIATFGSTGQTVVFQPDGKIVAAGGFIVPGNFDNFGLVRYNVDGSPDNSFGTSWVGDYQFWS